MFRCTEAIVVVRLSVRGISPFVTKFFEYKSIYLFLCILRTNKWPMKAVQYIQHFQNVWGVSSVLSHLATLANNKVIYLHRILDIIGL